MSVTDPRFAGIPQQRNHKHSRHSTLGCHQRQTLIVNSMKFFSVNAFNPQLASTTILLYPNPVAFDFSELASFRLTRLVLSHRRLPLFFPRSYSHLQSQSHKMAEITHDTIKGMSAFFLIANCAVPLQLAQSVLSA